MAKHIETDILAILRQFNIAGELSARSSITDVKSYSERQFSRVISFKFERQKYLIIFDPTASDDESIVMEHILQDEPAIRGELVRNPLQEARAFGMPYKGKDVYVFQALSPKQRLDKELTERYPDLSRSTIQKYIKAGYVSVNNRMITQPKYDVSPYDTIAMTPPKKQNHTEKELPIVYLDDQVIVIDKPAGVLTHSKGVMNDEFTVADFFRRYTTVGLETNRPGIVHRLDRDTSGIIIGARTSEAADLLKKQFANRTVKKTYQALVDGLPKQPKALIDVPIGRNPSLPSTFRVDPAGKPAQTLYEVTKPSATLSMVQLSPKTGRTHQLRVHMQYLNTPIHGDRLYGGQPADRLYLHAAALEITIPESRRTTFQAPLPEEFTNALKEVL